jgi:hypothetical protein
MVLFLEHAADDFLGDFWSWDPASTSWTILSGTENTPSARAQHGFASMNGTLYLFGGRSTSGSKY